MSQHSRREFLKGVAGSLGAAALSPIATTAPGPAEASSVIEELPSGNGAGTSLSADTELSLPERTAGRSRAGPPNVVFILSDQHRWQSMSFTETPRLSTPTMQKIAEEGFSFSRCISQYPLCSPSRAMLLTGRWPHETGVIDNSTRYHFALDQGEKTIGRIFDAAGYRTGYIGKWHLGGGAESAIPYGFEESTIWTKTNDHWGSNYFLEAGDKHLSHLYNAEHMTSQALSFMDSSDERPFFLMLSWNPPHSNYTDAPARFKGRYSSLDSLPLRHNVEMPKVGSDLDFLYQYWGYHAHVSAIDHELSRIFAKLQDLGVADNTIVVYSSDHGDTLGSHGHIGKRVPYAESVRVPLLVHWPERIEPGKSDVPIGTMDVLPTVCSLAGVHVPRICSGMDFSPTLLGKKGPEPESQLIMNISNAHPPQNDRFPSDFYRGLVSTRYTYAERSDGPWLLFDDEKDPYQQQNLAADPAHAELRKNLHSQLVQWLEKAQDPYPLRPPTS